MAEKKDSHDSGKMTMRERFSHFNAMLVFVMLYMALCGFNFGYDVGTFGGVQGMQSFASKFGEYQQSTKLYALPSWLASLMTATPFLGKAIGCVICGPIAHKWGRRAAILALCILSFIGVALQTSATTAAQFTIGRIITFAMTGMTIVVVPIYQAEASPRVLRGMFGSMIQAMIIFGQVIATLICYGTQNIPDAKGWQIPVGLQFITPALIFVMLPLLPESPRWLLTQGRREEALKSLQKLRQGYSTEKIELELDAITYANNTENKGKWADIFSISNRRRTFVAILAMFGQQITGQAFPSQYGVIFYQSQGFRSSAFLFNVVSAVLSLVAVMFTWLYVDSIGRRPVLLVGGTFMGIWLYILGSVGALPPANLTDQTKGLMVASVMLFSFFFNLSWAPISYVVVSETAAQSVREKTNLVACVISVLTTFVTSFTCPYLIGAKYANLGGKVGFIYGSFTIIMVVATWFFIPELKNRTLEEVDQLFASGVPLRKFASVKTKTAEELYLNRHEKPSAAAAQIGGSTSTDNAPSRPA